MTDYSGGLSSAYELDADLVVSTVTPVDVPGLSFGTSPNGLYLISINGTFMTSAGNSGIGLQVIAPDATSVSGMCSNLGGAGQAMSVGEQVVSGALSNAGTSGARAANVEVPVQGSWKVKMGANGGVVKMQARPETAGSTMTLKAGTIMQVWAF